MSEQRLAAARQADPAGADARRLAFDAAYLLLSSVATGDERAGLGVPDPALARLGIARLGLTKDDEELAQALSSAYTLDGWETLQLEFMHDWAALVLQFARHAFLGG